MTLGMNSSGFSGHVSFTCSGSRNILVGAFGGGLALHCGNGVRLGG